MQMSVSQVSKGMSLCYGTGCRTLTKADFLLVSNDRPSDSPLCWKAVRWLETSER
jgi:hypothetical protein